MSGFKLLFPDGTNESFDWPGETEKEFDDGLLGQIIKKSQEMFKKTPKTLIYETKKVKMTVEIKPGAY